MFQHYYNGNTDLGARIVSVLAEAEGGNLWVGSDDAGLFHWDKKSNSFTPVRNRHLDSGSAYKNIHSLLQVGDKLMIGMYMGGLDVLDLKTGNLKNYMAGSSSRSLYSSSIYSILKDGDGRIWIGTSSGLNRYCPETDDFERIFEVHPADIACIIEDKRGYIWVSTSDMGMYRMEKKTGNGNIYRLIWKILKILSDSLRIPSSRHIATKRGIFGSVRMARVCFVMIMNPGNSCKRSCQFMG